MASNFTCDIEKEKLNQLVIEKSVLKDIFNTYSRIEDVNLQKNGIDYIGTILGIDKEFKIDARGYRPQEVDQFLDMVIKDYVDTENTIRKLIAEIKSLEAENTKLRSEVRNLKTSLDIAGSNKVTNVDLLKRISDLEKVVYGE